MGVALPDEKFDVTPETPTDVAAIRAVVQRAFATHVEVADMVESIRASARYIPELALVARMHDEVVGFVMISTVDLVDEAGRIREILSLTPLAVDPPFQRRGIGSALVRKAVAAAEATGAPLVVLEGSPRYYGRLGSRWAPDFAVELTLPDWAPREAAQVFPLSGYDAEYRGRVVYPPAIAAVTS